MELQAFLFRLIKTLQFGAGMKPVLKNIRLTCCSVLIEAGVPTMVVNDFLGHASGTTTEAFYVNTKNALRPAAEKRWKMLEG
ncbi:MAG: hypothetical protein COA78_21775 [Blastopirellula sp.]|nr:MAG: hypothetical protein COA78_21775 [Blastopirellula sp.]